MKLKKMKWNLRGIFRNQNCNLGYKINNNNKKKKTNLFCFIKRKKRKRERKNSSV